MSRLYLNVRAAAGAPIIIGDILDNSSDNLYEIQLTLSVHGSRAKVAMQKDEVKLMYVTRFPCMQWCYCDVLTHMEMLPYRHLMSLYDLYCDFLIIRQLGPPHCVY